MSGGKWTPGPWKWAAGALFGGSTLLVQVASANSREEISASPSDKALMAAAPELVEALAELRAGLDTMRAATLCQGSEWVAMMARADAALRKAGAGE